MVVSPSDCHLKDYHIDYSDLFNHSVATRRYYSRTSSGTKTGAVPDRVPHSNLFFDLNRLSRLGVL